MVKRLVSLVTVLVLSHSHLVLASETENKLAELERELLRLKQQVSELEKSESEETEEKHSDIKLYSTLRPTFGFIDDDDEDIADVRDALSHAGFKSTKQFADGWTGILHGEWGIDLANNGDFGKARQVYVAIDSPYGRVGIGKQRPAQYLFIAEYVDLFNHSNSPFAYDPESLFFVNNLLTYQKKIDAFTFIIVGQFNGENGADYDDLVNTGLSYDKNDLHLAVTYTEQNIAAQDAVQGTDEIVAFSAAYQLTEQLYGAIGYQDKSYRRFGIADRDGHTLDVSFAYQLHQNYKLKFGYFEFDDGISTNISQQYTGSNLTFEWLPTDNMRIHAEYLYKDHDHQGEFSSVSVGFRYDYAQSWRF